VHRAICCLRSDPRGLQAALKSAGTAGGGESGRAQAVANWRRAKPGWGKRIGCQALYPLVAHQSISQEEMEQPVQSNWRPSAVESSQRAIETARRGGCGEGVGCTTRK